MDSHYEKHLELIQGVIGRLSQNSFSIRGWTVTVISALLALSSHTSIQHFAFAPSLFFWMLDAYYLRQERLFRKLYEAVRKEATKTEAERNIELFSMDTSAYRKDVPNWCATMFSKTIALIYVPVFVITAGVQYYLTKGSP